MDTVWTKNASCQELRKNTWHTAGTKRKKCQELRKNTRHTAGTKRKKCHKCYAYTALTTIHQIDTLLNINVQMLHLHSTHYDSSNRHTIEKVNKE